MIGKDSYESVLTNFFRCSFLFSYNTEVCLLIDTFRSVSWLIWSEMENKQKNNHEPGPSEDMPHLRPYRITNTLSVCHIPVTVHKSKARGTTNTRRTESRSHAKTNWCRNMSDSENQPNRQTNGKQLQQMDCEWIFRRTHPRGAEDCVTYRFGVLMHFCPQ